MKGIEGMGISVNKQVARFSRALLFTKALSNTSNERSIHDNVRVIHQTAPELIKDVRHRRARGATRPIAG
ncbi:hypothetical protein D3C77_640440 [compost metagenome]